jgi:hypothetical protein
LQMHAGELQEITPVVQDSSQLQAG